MLDSEIQASLEIALTDWIASVERDMTQMTEEAALTTIDFHQLDLKVSIEKRVLGRIRSPDDSQLSNTVVFVNKA